MFLPIARDSHLVLRGILFFVSLWQRKSGFIFCARAKVLRGKRRMGGWSADSAMIVIDLLAQRSIMIDKKNPSYSYEPTSAAFRAVKSIQICRGLCGRFSTSIPSVIITNFYSNQKNECAHLLHFLSLRLLSRLWRRSRSVFPPSHSKLHFRGFPVHLSALCAATPAPSTRRLPR